VKEEQMLRISIAGILGFIIGVAATVLIADSYGIIDPIKSSTERALADRIESISDEDICAAIKEGTLPPGPDHASLWHDDKRYLVAGWTVDTSGIR
jgi:hypothetical protein